MTGANSGAESGSGPVVRRVVAFDFDGTLTRRDTLVPFLARLYGPARVVAHGAAVGPPWRRAPGVHRRDEMKAQLLRRLTAGDDPGRVAEAGEAYAAELEAALLPHMVERIEAHRAAGHELVAVSASMSAYLDPLLGERLGFDAVMAVGLLVGDDGRLSGEMLGPNVRGPHKEVVLRRWLAETATREGELELWAYGNSSGDAELLAMAQHATKVDGRRPTPLPPLV